MHLELNSTLSTGLIFLGFHSSLSIFHYHLFLFSYFLFSTFLFSIFHSSLSVFGVVPLGISSKNAEVTRIRSLYAHTKLFLVLDLCLQVQPMRGGWLRTHRSSPCPTLGALSGAS